MRPIRKICLFFSYMHFGGTAPPPIGTVYPDVPSAFDSPPYAVSSNGTVAIKGHKKNTGSIAKLLQDIEGVWPIKAGHTYTMRYTADWSQMTNLGKNNEVAWTFKKNNDFFMVGLKGNGAGGLTVHQISGPNEWNATSGFAETDTGAPHNGTLSGPNYIQLVVSSDGSHISFLTSGDDGITFNAELSNITFPPMTNVSQIINWGPGVFLDAADSGPFTITIDVWDVVTNPAVTYLDNDYANFLLNVYN